MRDNARGRGVNTEYAEHTEYTEYTENAEDAEDAEQKSEEFFEFSRLARRRSPMPPGIGAGEAKRECGPLRIQPAQRQPQVCNA